MKNRLLLLFFFAALSLHAQIPFYTPFPTGDASWYSRYYDDTGNPTSTIGLIRTGGDTIIQSQVYKKFMAGTYYLGAYRNDAKRVYYVPDTSSQEYLLYDFGVQVGDTIHDPFGGATCAWAPIRVAQMDSILLDDGYHTIYYFDQPTPYWIEGVGSNQYLLEPMQTLCVSGNPYLECMINYDAFSCGSASYCTVSTTPALPEAPKLTVSPNPSYGNATVQVMSADVTTVELRDLLGKVVFRRQVKPFESFPVETPGSGTWFLMATDTQGRETVLKLLCYP